VLEGTPLLAQVMAGGRRVSPPVPLERQRQHARSELARLPEDLRSLGRPLLPFRVEVSPRLAAEREALARALSARASARRAHG
jgi:nicotinate phosphoribosyltransferase